MCRSEHSPATQPQGLRSNAALVGCSDTLGRGREWFTFPAAHRRSKKEVEARENEKRQKGARDHPDIPNVKGAHTLRVELANEVAMLAEHVAAISALLDPSTSGHDEERGEIH